MGVGELRDSFNNVAGPAYSCHLALLDYQRHSGDEVQVLRLSGSSADGTLFQITSAPLGPNTNLNDAAKDMARNLVANGIPK